MENHAVIIKGFQALRETLAPYIARELSLEYGSNVWWRDGVIKVLREDQKTHLPQSGDFTELTDSLDIAMCVLLFADIHWQYIFKKKLSIYHRSWAKELKTFRDDTAHIGGKDFSEDDTWRALDTMSRFCKGIDEECSQELRKIRDGFKNAVSAGKRKSEALPDNINSINSEALICDLCGGSMVVRNGPYSKFWGCSNYPRCKNTKSITVIEKPSALKTVVLVSCAAKQRVGRWKAQQLYESDSFKESLSCAQKISNDVFILSSAHGLLGLDVEIENYDVHQGSKSPEELIAWGERVAKQLEEHGIDKNDTEFIILAWGDYYRPLLNHLPHYCIPLRGIRSYEKSRRLKEFLIERSRHYEY